MRSEDDYKVSGLRVNEDAYREISEMNKKQKSQGYLLWNLRNHLASWIDLLKKDGINSKSLVREEMETKLEELDKYYDEWFRKREEENENNN